jgi:hypothetical protein
MYHKISILLLLLLQLNCGLNRYSDYEICEKRAKEKALLNDLLYYDLFFKRNVEVTSDVIGLYFVFQTITDLYLKSCKQAADEGKPLPN